jgi:hypothetical protein
MESKHYQLLEIQHIADRYKWYEYSNTMNQKETVHIKNIERLLKTWHSTVLYLLVQL